MILRQIRRYISEQQRVQQLLDSLPKDQYLPKAGRGYTHPHLKVKGSMPEYFEDMKQQFGQDYKTPDEKYDLHVPKHEAQGTKSSFERYHERHNFSQSRAIMRILFGGLIVGSLVYQRKITGDKKYLEQSLAREKIEHKENVKNAKITEKILDKRREKVKEIEEKYKKEKGVTMTSNRLSS